MRIHICSLLAAFIGGAGVALLASYPIPKNSLYVCFWALLLAVTACLLGAWAIADHAVRRERVKVDGVVAAVVDNLLSDKGLRSVDRT